MPSVSRFYGIVIYIYFKDHAPPHFHAIYGEHEAELEIKTGRVLKGDLPTRVLSLVREWSKMRRTELLVDWDLAQKQQPLNSIKPLK